MDTSTWRKCFSIKRKRSYYHNVNNGISVWTVEDTLKPSNNEIKKDNSNERQSEKIKQDNLKSKAKPKPKTNKIEKIEQEKLQPKDEKQIKAKENGAQTKQKNVKRPLKSDSEAEDNDEPMDVDDIVENVTLKLTRNKIEEFLMFSIL